MKKALALFLLLPGLVFATDYHVGPGQSYTSISAVPWYSLVGGDTVYIHYRSTPYKEKFNISTVGTASAWLRVLGVPDPATGALPVISGDGATTSTNSHFHWQDATGGSAIQNGGVVFISPSPPNNLLPAYIEIGNLRIQDSGSAYSFTAENGTSANYDDFSACIYARTVSHLLIHDNVLTNCGLGFYDWTGTGGSPTTWWDGVVSDVTLRGNYFFNNGASGSYLTHQTYTESDGVVIEYNHYGPQKSGCLGSQLKDRSAGTVVRYNWIEQSPSGWGLDLVEPENGWYYLGKGSGTLNNAKYGHDFVYGNIFVDKGDVGEDFFHWNEDHQMGHGRSLQSGSKLAFYDNTIVATANTAYWPIVLFNETWGGFDCPSAAQPGVIDVRNNIFSMTPINGSSPNVWSWGYCGSENITLGKNWISPGWTSYHTTGSGSVTGSANLVSPTNNTVGFVSLTGNDFHLASGSSAIGIGGVLVNDVTSNPIGQDFTPIYQYLDPQNITPRTSSGVGSDAGAFAYSGSGGGPTISSISVSPATSSKAVGATQQFTCTATYSDNSTSDCTTAATWSSTAPGVATVGAATGLATGIATGSATIRANYGEFTATAALTVTPAVTLVGVAVTPATASRTVGQTQQFTCTATYSDTSTANCTSTATWTSTATGVATVNAAGLATAVAAGSATIRATYGGLYGTGTMAVTSGSGLRWFWPFLWRH